MNPLISRVRIWRDPVRTHIWWCTRLDIPECPLFNPMASGCNAWVAYENYKEMLS